MAEDKLQYEIAIKPPVQMRPRKLNAAWDKPNFPTPRMNVAHFHDKFKPNHISEEIIRSQANQNVQSKTPVQPVKVIQKAKVLNRDANQQTQRIAVKREFKQPMQKPAGIKKVAAQKKTLAAKATNQTIKKKVPAQMANFEQTLTKLKKLTKVPNKQIESNKLQKVIAAQKTKLENEVVSTVNNNQETVDSVIVAKTQNASPKDTNSQENIPQENVPVKNNSAQEVLGDQQIKPVVEENKTEETETPNNEKESAAPSTEKQETVEAKSEASEGDKKELDPLLARAVEEELQDIMIQVWQELPDDPSEEADRVAVEVLRNEAGDDLRRVLGLNITQRLLNVFNNLFIKVQFTCRPQMGCLTSFLNEYRINKFKRIDKNSNTFAAQMETIEDFDKLCALKEIICGEAKVIVTPCYKFTQCPESLKSIYDDTFFYEDKNEEVQKQSEALKSKSTKIPSPNNKVTNLAKKLVSTDLKCDIQKPQVSKENLVKAAAIAENNEVKCEAQNVKVAAPSENITSPANTGGDREEVMATTPNESVAKPTKKAVSIAAEIPKKTLIAESDNPVRNDCVKVKSNPTPINKEKTSNTAIVNTKDTKCKEKEVTNVKVTKKMVKDIDEDIKELIIKDILENEDIDEFDASVPESEMECDEELNDEDILALMSEGVVLDECCGSEDET